MSAQFIRNMKKVLVIGFFIYSNFSFAQIAPDSLIGTYVGTYWFREWNNAWEISESDTVWVFSVDTLQCKISFGRSFNERFAYFDGWNDFETSYSFCIGNSNNFFKRFYATDSLFMKIDDISPPPPDYNPISIRYYGKKVSSKILSIPIEPLPNIAVYPNPFAREISIKYDVPGIFAMALFDVKGNRVYYAESVINLEEYTIHVPNLARGIYYLQLINKRQSFHFMLSKQ